MTRTGYYVDGRWYSLAHRSQAIARADFLAAEYSRSVTVAMVDHLGLPRVTYTSTFTPTLSSMRLACG